MLRHASAARPLIPTLASFCTRQASITALPPPDKWNDHVLAYLGSMGVDHHRGMMRSTIMQIRELLPITMKCGWQHPSYQQLLKVRRPREEQRSAEGIERPSEYSRECIRVTAWHRYSQPRVLSPSHLVCPHPSELDAAAVGHHVPPASQPVGHHGQPELRS